jgi:ribosomal protein S12 methylthiotransferase accessory factor
MSPVTKNFRAGTDRAADPRDTLARASAFTTAMGITRVANITGLDCIGIPVVMVCRPNSRSLAVSQGKGLDLDAARASGVMESIEFYHAERVQLPLVLASFSEMRQHRRVVDVSRLPRVRTTHFHADLPLLWIEGHNLLTDEPSWLPYEMLQLNMTLPAPPGTGCFLGGSNGLASGNHVLEAVSHAICEVVERDASTMLDLLPPDRVAERRVDLGTVDDAACCQLLERYAAADVDVAVWDMTSDVGIAAFVCHIVDRSDDPRRALYAAAGMGCHPTRRVALLRALTEAAQERLALIAGTRDDLFRHGYERARSIEALRNTRALIQSDPSTSTSTARGFRQTPDWDVDTFDADIAWELDHLRQAGIDEVVMVDLTRPEFQMPVVHVSIPGLESASWVDEFAPGSRARARTASRGEMA